MSQALRRTTQRYLEVMRLNGAAHALRAATRLGLFDALRSGQKTTEEVAAACGTRVAPTGLLLDVLQSLGVVEHYGDDWALAPAMQLLTECDADLGDSHWEMLDEFVRTGRSLAEQESDEAYRASAAASQWTLTPAAMELAVTLEIGERRRKLRILDLGAGTGVWSLAIAYRDPESHITVADWAEPLAVAKETAASIGLTGRFETLAGDWRELPLPDESFDLILAANVVQLESDERLERLFDRLFAATRPGGELAIVDVFPGQSQGDLHRKLFSLRLALRTSDGRTRSPDELQHRLQTAGFAKPHYAHLQAEPHVLGVLVARRPGNGEAEVDDDADGNSEA